MLPLPVPASVYGLVLLLAALGAFGAAAETTVGMSGAGSFKMEQVYVNVPELDVYFYALDGDGNSYSPIKVQAAGPELTLGDRRLEVRSVAAASDPICYILALDNSKSIAPSEFYTMLGGVRKLINAMGDDDQLMLYTTAGSTECVLPATSDKNLMYKTLGSIKQVEGSMDTARLISAVYSELQSDYQALAPRKAAMIVTDAGQVLTNMALFATLASDVSDQIGMAAYIYLMTDRPGAFETLESAADGRLVLCEASTLGDELKKKQEYFATALEIKTEVPESLYGERLETLTLAMPQLGSAIRSSQTVYMGYRLAKPQVTKVETLRRDKLRLTFNQPINENANKPQLYEVRSKDIWNWRVQVKSVTISEDARTADLEIEPLYKGDYTVALNRVSSKMSAANVSSSRDTATFKVVVWPRDRAFYFARFRGPLLIAAVLLLVCAAVYMNWRYTDDIQKNAGKTLGQTTLVSSQDGEKGTEPTAAPAEDDYFATARLSRKQARDNAISMLKEAERDENAQQSVLNEASQTLQVLAAYTVAESQIESLVTAKGYADCVVFMGAESVSVVVAPPEGGLTATDAARIKDIVISETDYTAQQIKIMEAN